MRSRIIRVDAQRQSPHKSTLVEVEIRKLCINEIAGAGGEKFYLASSIEAAAAICEILYWYYLRVSFLFEKLFGMRKIKFKKSCGGNYCCYFTFLLQGSYSTFMHNNCVHLTRAILQQPSFSHHSKFRMEVTSMKLLSNEVKAQPGVIVHAYFVVLLLFHQFYGFLWVFQAQFAIHMPGFKVQQAHTD